MTFIEMMMAIAIFMIVIVGLSSMILNTYDINHFALLQSNAVSEAKKGIELMTKEIREASTGQDGAYVIASAQDFQFTFYSDIDKDDEIERVRYFIEEDKFKKGVVEPTGIPAVYLLETEEIKIISYYVINTPPIFRYFDGEGDELSAPARKKDTKLMKLTLEIDVNPGDNPSPFILISETQIRNIKNNL